MFKDTTSLPSYHLTIPPKTYDSLVRSFLKSAEKDEFIWLYSSWVVVLWHWQMLLSVANSITTKLWRNTCDTTSVSTLYHPSQYRARMYYINIIIIIIMYKVSYNIGITHPNISVIMYNDIAIHCYCLIYCYYCFLNRYCYKDLL